MFFSSPSAPGIPVTLVTGPRGSGKTRLIQRWLAQPTGAGTLVVLMEQGATSLRHPLQASCAGGGFLTHAMGCACCGVRAGLAQVLRDLPWRFARGGSRVFDRIVIEVAEAVDPAVVRQTVLRQPAAGVRYHLERSVAVLPGDANDA